MSGRILAIGDVHGCHAALLALLATIELTPDDTIVFLGDIVDRGPSTKQTVDEVLKLQKAHNVIVIMGNHEEMMRGAIAGRGIYDAWFEVGGQEAMNSYDGSIDNIPSEHIRMLVTGRAFYETDNEIFIHASLESDVSMPNQTTDFLRWKHIGGSERPHVSGKRVICGHTEQTDGYPLVMKGWVCIDTYAHGGKWLSCLDVTHDHIYQASQSGQTREFKLSEVS